MDLSALWHELVSGRTRVADSFCTKQRCFLILQAARGASVASGRLSARNVQFLERVLLGHGQKCVALDSQLAPSTIALTVAECLRAMGLDRRPSRAPAVLAMALHAYRGESEFRVARVSELHHAGKTYRAVSTVRPDLALYDLLSPAEYEVVRLLIEGKTYAEIAMVRNTSVRTIANQIGSAFQKLSVSGRGELLGHLVRRKGSAGYAA